MTAPKTIAGILLVPAKGSDLLAGGECGARPPMVWERTDWSSGGWHACPGPPGLRRALPLAWGGKVLRIACAWWKPGDGHLAVAVGICLAYPGSTVLRQLHRWAADAGHTLLLVGSDGRTIDTDGGEK